MPMVFSMHNYVRAARILSLDRDWDGGRIARRALNVQLADIFTKPLDEKVFCRLRGELNITDASNLE